jgi:hypothetical protein
LSIHLTSIVENGEAFKLDAELCGLFQVRTHNKGTGQRASAIFESETILLSNEAPSRSQRLLWNTVFKAGDHVDMGRTSFGSRSDNLTGKAGETGVESKESPEAGFEYVC